VAEQSGQGPVHEAGTDTWVGILLPLFFGAGHGEE
jgi:hypothetical protein